MIGFSLRAALSLCPSLAHASPESDLASASAALAAGDLSGAEAGYRAILASGPMDADVYYDLGNVLYRGGKLAPAILAWRRAEALSPRDPDVQANLDFARRGLVDRLDTPRGSPAFAPWQIALTPGEGRWLGAGLSGLALLVLGVRALGARMFGGTGSRLQLPVAPAVGVLVIGLVVQAGAVASAREPAIAVILPTEVTATSDLGGGVDLFTLHAGAEVRLVERAAGHALVQLPDGRKGWLAEESVGVADPYAPFPVL